MCVIIINLIRGHRFENEKGWIYERVWKQERDCRNNVIILQSHKKNNGEPMKSFQILISRYRENTDTELHKIPS